MLKLLAGFECGYLEWCKQDLLITTRHLPAFDMLNHYMLAKQAGFCSARDGLTIGHHIIERWNIGKKSGFEEIWWDLHHWRAVEKKHISQHASHVAHQLNSVMQPNETFYYCAVNEPHQYPPQALQPVDHALELAIETHKVLRNEMPNVRSMSVDPMGNCDEEEFWATDCQVAAGYVDIVGFNCYPHTLRRPIHEILICAHKRYNKPIMLSETSWHNGHPEHDGRYPHLKHKGDWLKHVIGEVEIAIENGVDIEGVGWYPVVDTPHWGEPELGRWPHGLIKEDLQYDLDLLEALAKYNTKGKVSEVV